MGKTQVRVNSSFTEWSGHIGEEENLMFCATTDCFTWIEKQNKENPVKMELVHHLIFDVQSTETVIYQRKTNFFKNYSVLVR